MQTLLAAILLSATVQAADIGKLKFYPFVSVEFEANCKIIANGKHVTCSELKALNPAMFRGIGKRPPILTADCHFNPLLHP